ncbi:GNAT family N-acetyltransferase [Bacillus sp. REN10]|uniref:GNAT family N-acetyltransferase n=1 Tax=Bacillus sp. REN10 TaxID=2782541 RepID=UPI00193B9D35
MSDRTKVDIAPLRQADLPFVYEWTKEWLGSEHPTAYSLTIFSSKGYTRFLAHQQSLPLSHQPSRLFGAYRGKQLLGFIEIRLMTDCLFINNFCVRKEARGQRIGQVLIDYAVSLARDCQLPAIRLDCFAWNEKALSMYMKAGFQVLESIHWFIGKNPSATEKNSEDFLIEGFSKAEASHKEFGFSHFQVRTTEHLYSVHRLHDQYFRMTAHEKEVDPVHLSILSQIDAERLIFVISPSAELHGSGWNEVSKSVRLERFV